MDGKRKRLLLAVPLLASALVLAKGARAAYVETDLVSDIPLRAKFTDPNLVNPWGIADSATGPLWVSDNGTGLATIYNGAGMAQSLVVTIPPPMNSMVTAAPTGQVFNPGANFELAPGLPAKFIFATEDGTISGWNPGVNPTNAVLAIDLSSQGAVFKGLAIDGAGDTLYATDFHNDKVDVFDSAFTPVNTPGAFTDSTLPAGYAPFGIRDIGGEVYVTYALQNAAKHDDVAGLGHGFIDVFGETGTFIKRLVSDSVLNSPWGLAIAPAGFGPFAGDLLVGNFGDGHVNVFDPGTGALLGALMDRHGHDIAIDGLWGLQPGNGGSGGAVGTVYFTAGLNHEADGLFGTLSFTTQLPEPGTLGITALGLLAVARLVRRRR